MGHRIILTVAPELDVIDVASNSLGGLASPAEGLLNGRTPGCWATSTPS